MKDGRIAPNKAILLLSVAELVRKGVILSDEIKLDSSLRAQYEKLWNQYVGKNQIFVCNPDNSFKNMDDEPFWRLADNDTAIITEELISLLKDDESYNVLKTILIKNYIPIIPDSTVSQQPMQNESSTNVDNDALAKTPENEFPTEKKDSPMGIDSYITSLSNMRANRSGNKLLPYRAIVMLTVADLICSGLIESPKIQCDKLFKQQFALNWEKYSKDTSVFGIPDVRKQILFMEKEDFWSVSEQEDSIAVLNMALFTYFKNRRTCYRLRKALVDRYLPSSIDDFIAEYSIVNADIMY